MLWNTGENQMIKGFILSLQFFTRIPINVAVDFNKRNIGYSIIFLPLVGAIIGSLGAFVYIVFQAHNKLVAGFLTLLTTIMVTGGLHLDGLSDTFDGFFSNQNKEKTLEIMKDSRIGAFGVLSIVLLILFKFILIISIDKLPLGIILSFVNSRFIVSRIISYKKAAKREGLGNLFHKTNSKKVINISLFIYIVVLLMFNIKYLLPLAMTYFLGEYISKLAYKKVNGLTGDVHGAIIELGEVISLFGFWGVMLWI